MRSSNLERYLDQLLASGAVTAAAAVIGDATGVSCEGARGATRKRGGARVSTSSLFDLASLTKPVVATLALALDADGTLPLARSVGKAAVGAGFDSQPPPGLMRTRLGSLLRHRAGLVPWAPLFELCARPELCGPWLLSQPGLLGAPPSTYSDLDFILWGQLAERNTGIGLAELIEAQVAQRLSPGGLGPAPGADVDAVECRLGNARERELARAQGLEIGRRGAPRPGTPQDGNAQFLGVSGHAGLFGSARGLWALGREWALPRRLLRPRSVRAALGGRGAYALGWRRRPPAARHRAGLWYGHLGFTGGGAWFCPETGEVRVLLAHRSSVRIQLADWRRAFVELSV